MAITQMTILSKIIKRHPSADIVATKGLIHWDYHILEYVPVIAKKTNLIRSCAMCLGIREDCFCAS